LSSSLEQAGPRPRTPTGYWTYTTTSRGVDRLMFRQNMLDLCPYGRQEAWEDSPPGWPRQPSYTDEQ
jgi:predicted dithiol-disulfide oxidoreductase (DUF899 family)